MAAFYSLLCKAIKKQPAGRSGRLFWRSGRDSNPRAIARKLISSQPRYDHFDTAAYQIVRTQIRITVSILLAFFRSAAHTRARKPLGDIAFLLLARPADVAISSQLRYDHFDTAATGCGRVASQSHNHRID